MLFSFVGLQTETVYYYFANLSNGGNERFYQPD